MRASRLLSILLTLQARGTATAAVLADALEVSERTIHRDIDQLSAAGIPVIADRGRSGGFRLADGFRTQLTGLTPAEADALFLSGLPGPAADLGLTDVMTMARTKLMAALPQGARAERLATRFHLDATGWFRASDDTAQLPAIARAVWSERLIRFQYDTGAGVAPRLAAPLGVVLKGGIWYLVAQRGAAIRTYRVAKVHDVEVTDDPFVRPARFELAAWWTRAARDYEASNYRGEAVIRLSPRGRRMVEMLGPYVADAVVRARLAFDDQGWMRCTIPVESVEFTVRELMRLGAEVEVVRPAALRKALVATLEATLARYTH
jgi:predicted DNA-binding transcriptional regulator YafY